MEDSFYLVNIYCQFRDSIEISLLKLDAILSQIKGRAIMTGDFNACWTVWIDRITNNRGKKLEDSIERCNLFVVNEPYNISTSVHNEELVVDVTLAH